MTNIKKKFLILTLFQVFIHVIWHILNVILQNHRGIKISILLLLGGVLSLLIVKLLLKAKNSLNIFFRLYLVLYFTFEVIGLTSYFLNLNPKYLDTPIFIGIIIRSFVILLYMLFLSGIIYVIKRSKCFYKLR